MTSSEIVKSISSARPVRVHLDDGEATAVLRAVGVKFEIGLARQAGNASIAFALLICAGSAAGGGILAAGFGFGPLGIGVAALLAGLLAADSVNYRLRLQILPAGQILLEGAREG